MSCVDSAEFRGFRSKRDQFLSLCIRSGSVLKRGGNSDGAVLHRFTDQLFHFIELRGRGLLVFETNHERPNLRRAYVGSEIDADALFLKAREIFAERSPIRLNVEVVILVRLSFDHGIVQGCDRRAFARNFSRDALVDFGRKARIHEDRELRLAEHVDKAGSNDQAMGINRPLGGSTGQIGDGYDLAVANTNVSRIPGRARAVDDVAMSDDDVVGRNRLRWRERGKSQQKD